MPHVPRAAGARPLARKIDARGGDLRRANSLRPSISNTMGSPRDGTSRGACGITIEKFQDIKEGDVIEAYLMEQIEV